MRAANRSVVAAYLAPELCLFVKEKTMVMYRLIRIAALPAVAIAGIQCDSPESPAADGSEPPTVSIAAGESGFSPAEVEVEAGRTTVLEFTRTADRTCATAVHFPESGIEHDLPAGEPVRISVRPEPGQSIAFACPMDMYTGSITAGDTPSDGNRNEGSSGSAQKQRTSEGTSE